EAHFVTARVTYPDAEPGTLLYVKPTMTGDEPPELRTFRKANPSFPHHSTVEQVFEWTMVDAYRQLGRHIGAEVAGRLGALGAERERYRSEFDDVLRQLDHLEHEFGSRQRTGVASLWDYVPKISHALDELSPPGPAQKKRTMRRRAGA